MSSKANSTAPSPKKTKQKSKATQSLQGGSGTANRLAVAILEVLAGVRTPADAAAALEISLPRYYQLEVRAIEGMVQACEPRPKGKQPSPEKHVAKLERELESAKRETARQVALVRAAHRSLGLKAPPDPAKQPRDHRGRQKRRPTIRALKAARVLKKKVGTDDAVPVQRQNDHGSTTQSNAARGHA